MNRLSDGDLSKIQKALSFIYHKRDDVVIGDAWEKGVMAHIRESKMSGGTFDFGALLDRYFWRFAPVAALSLLVLSCILYQQMASFSEYETARTLMGNTWADSFSQILGAS